MHDETDEVSLRVGDDMTLASLDLFSGVESTRSATFRDLRRLAVDDAGGRARLAAGLLARAAMTKA